jgi:hypothetical protein
MGQLYLRLDVSFRTSDCRHAAALLMFKIESVLRVALLLWLKPDCRLAGTVWSWLQHQCAVSGPHMGPKCRQKEAVGYRNL